MKINKLNIRFIVPKNLTRKDGSTPIECRITYLGQRHPFKTGQFLNPKFWDNKLQEAKPPTPENNHINTQLSLIKQNVSQAFLFLQVNQPDFDVHDIYDQYSGKKTRREKMILEMFKEHNDQMRKLVGKDYVLATVWKFEQSLELLRGFIKHQFNRPDYEFKKLDLKFVKDYEFYLKTEKNLALATTNKAVQRFRRIVRLAMAEDVINKDPFLLYRVKRTKKEITYLTPEELEKLEKHEFTQSRLQLVKDLFVFCCYTGLAYNEMNELRHDHIELGFDSLKWIQMTRGKTKRSISIPLLPKALEMIEKYRTDSAKVFKSPSNQKFNSYLKEIADVVGIEKNLTHHLARRTFATTVLLLNGVSMDVVSELLGHSNVRITQESYGKILKEKISGEILRLKKEGFKF